jgi:hypothetical protein
MLIVSGSKPSGMNVCSSLLNVKDVCGAVGFARSNGSTVTSTVIVICS